MGNSDSKQPTNQEQIAEGNLVSPLMGELQVTADEGENMNKANTKESKPETRGVQKKTKNKLDDIILNQKKLLPQQFSSFEELQKGYLDQKEKERKLLDEICEWEMNVLQISEITALAITNDDKLLISGTQTGLITVFDLETKKPIHRFKDNLQHKVNSIVMSEDGDYIVAAFKNDIEIYSISQKVEIVTLRSPHTSDILSLLISKDKKFVISAGEDCSIKIFDISNNSKKMIHHFAKIHQGNQIDISLSTIKGPIYSMAFSNDNQYFVSVSGDGSLKVFDFNKKTQIQHIPTVHQGPIYSVAISRDDNYIITGSADHSIKVFSFKTKEELHHFKEIHADEVRSIVISKDNKHIYSASKESIKILDLETKQEIFQIKDIHKKPLTSIAISNNGKYIFSGSLDGYIAITDPLAQQKSYLDDPQKDKINSISISKDNKYIVSASADGYIKIFDFQTKNLIPQLLRCGVRKSQNYQDY